MALQEIDPPFGTGSIKMKNTDILQISEEISVFLSLTKVMKIDQGNKLKINL